MIGTPRERRPLRLPTHRSAPSLASTRDTVMRPINGKAPEFEEAELVYMFQEMDTDGGGSVCYDEFAEAWAIEEDHGDGSGMVGIGA